MTEICQESPSQAPGNTRRLAYLCAAALALACLALNHRVMGFGFLYLRDDDINLTLNPNMGGLSLDRLRWMFTNSDYVRRYIPLGWLGFSATYQVAGLDPAPYHAAGMLLHALNAVLLFALIRSVLRLLPPASATEGGWTEVCALAGASWWAFSPMRVETTAWVSGNLYGEAVALALGSALCHVATFGRTGRARIPMLAASAALFAASLLSYPVAFGMPVALAGLDWLASRRGRGPGMRRLLLEKALYLGPLVAVASVTLLARLAAAPSYGAVPGLRELPLASRAAQSSYVACYYLWKPWWPLNLSPLYDALVTFSPTEPRFVACEGAAVLLCLASLAWARRWPWMGAVWLGHLALSAPFFGLTEWPHMTSDRYACLSSALAAAVAAAGLARLRPAWARGGAAILAALVLGLFIRLTLLQQGVWEDDAAQHAYVAARLTDPLLADDFRGRRLILQFLRGDEAAVERAVAEGLKANPSSPGLRKASEIIAEKLRLGAYYGDAPALAILHEQRGLAFARLRQYREANDHMQEALRMDDRFYQAAFDRALVLLHLGRCDDALRSFLLASTRAPSSVGADKRRAFLSALRAVALAEHEVGLAEAAGRALAR